MPTHSAELAAAIAAAEAAAEVIRALYQRNLAVTTKADQSPVTEADVRAEEAIHAVLRARFPGHGFYGEETGRHNGDAESLWLVDPIDGTKSFVRECPFFSTQIALMRGGELVLGVSSAPAYAEFAWAERGDIQNVHIRLNDHVQRAAREQVVVHEVPVASDTADARDQIAEATPLRRSSQGF